MTDLCGRWLSFVTWGFERLCKHFTDASEARSNFTIWFFFFKGEKEINCKTFPSSFLYWFPLPSLQQDVSLWSTFFPCEVNKAGIIYCVALVNRGLYIMKHWCNFMKDYCPLQQRLRSTRSSTMHISKASLSRGCLTMIPPLAGHETHRSSVPGRQGFICTM